MARTVAEHLVDTLAQAGVRRVYGIVGDSLNPVTDALRRNGSIQWVDVRHEETAAFAAGAEAQLTGRLAVCAGSCGPGNLHLINGLYDAHRSAAPVLAIAAHIPSSEVGTGYFQETHPDQLFRECSHYCELVSNPRQAPRVLQSAIQHAVSKRGVSVVVLPGDIAALEAPSDATPRSPVSAVPLQDGLAEAEARGRFSLVDKDGLLHTSRTDLTPEQRVYAQPAERVATWPRTSRGAIGLADVIGKVEATILIGLSTVGGAFAEPIVHEMARKVERPVIFPLSNPTTRSEANAEDLIRWTNGRALVATGSPYPSVQYEGRTFPIAQCNNVFIFPAVGLGVVASGARRVTDGMILAAAKALGEYSNPSGSLLPPLRDIRSVARAIATAVGLEAQRAGVAPKGSPEELRDRVAATQWTPEYGRAV